MWEYLERVVNGGRQHRLALILADLLDLTSEEGAQVLDFRAAFRN